MRCFLDFFYSGDPLPGLHWEFQLMGLKPILRIGSYLMFSVLSVKIGISIVYLKD